MQPVSLDLVGDLRCVGHAILPDAEALRGVAREGPETVMGVRDLDLGEQPGEQYTQLEHQPARPGQANRLPQETGAQSHIDRPSPIRLDQPLGLFRRKLAVGIKRHQDRCPAFQGKAQTSLQGGTLPPVDDMPENPHRMPQGHLAGIVV